MAQQGHPMPSSVNLADYPFQQLKQMRKDATYGLLSHAEEFRRGGEAKTGSLEGLDYSAMQKTPRMLPQAEEERLTHLRPTSALAALEHIEEDANALVSIIQQRKKKLAAPPKKSQE